MFKKLLLSIVLIIPSISYSQDQLPPTQAPAVQQSASPAMTTPPTASENWDRFKQERQAKKQREMEHKMKQEEMRLQHQMQMDAMKQEHKKNSDESYQREKEEFLKRFRKTPSEQAPSEELEVPSAPEATPLHENPVTVDEVQ